MMRTAIAAAQRQADTAKKAAKLAKLGFRHAKEKFKAAKRAAKKLRKAVKSLKAELVALGMKKGLRKRPAAKPVVKRSRPAAVAALEPHFRQRLVAELGLAGASEDQLQSAFLSRTAREWELWGARHDVPLAAVRDLPPEEDGAPG